MLITAVFELVQQFYLATEIGIATNATSASATQHSRQNKKIVPGKVNYRRTQS